MCSWFSFPIINVENMAGMSIGKPVRYGTFLKLELVLSRLSA